MWEEITIVVVDDDQQRRHDTQVIIEFLGEGAAVYSSEAWTELLCDPSAASGSENITQYNTQ